LPAEVYTYTNEEGYFGGEGEELIINHFSI